MATQSKAVSNLKAVAATHSGYSDSSISNHLMDISLENSAIVKVKKYTVCFRLPLQYVYRVNKTKLCLNYKPPKKSGKLFLTL